MKKIENMSLEELQAIELKIQKSILDKGIKLTFGNDKLSGSSGFGKNKKDKLC